MVWWLVLPRWKTWVVRRLCLFIRKPAPLRFRLTILFFDGSQAKRCCCWFARMNFDFIAFWLSKRNFGAYCDVMALFLIRLWKESGACKWLRVLKICLLLIFILFSGVKMNSNHSFSIHLAVSVLRYNNGKRGIDIEKGKHLCIGFKKFSFWALELLSWKIFG